MTVIETTLGGEPVDRYGMRVREEIVVSSVRSVQAYS